MKKNKDNKDIIDNKKDQKIKSKKMDVKLKNGILINILAFYFVSLFIVLFPSFIKTLIYICLMLCIYPIYILIGNIIVGFNKKYLWQKPLIDLIMILPVVLILTITPNCFNVFRVDSILLCLYIASGYLGLTLGFFANWIYRKIDKANKKAEKEEEKNQKSKQEESLNEEKKDINENVKVEEKKEEKSESESKNTDKLKDEKTKVVSKENEDNKEEKLEK